MVKRISKHMLVRRIEYSAAQTGSGVMSELGQIRSVALKQQ